MLKTILSIAGKPGLYKLVSQGRNMLIVESLSDKKRFPAYGNEKIISLGDIAMYTDAEDIPLSQVLTNVKNKENGQPASLDPKKASQDECFPRSTETAFMLRISRNSSLGITC